MNDARELYLDLLKRCLIGETIRDGSYEGDALRKHDPDLRREGRDWPIISPTMIGRLRIDHLHECLKVIVEEGIPGDLIETGVWRGGAAMFMRGFLKAYGISDRVVWAADSFEGLPEPDEERYPQDAGDIHHESLELAVSLENVKANFEAYGLLDEQTRFLKGWFRDTLPDAPVERLALLRLDGDMYQSTWEALEALYPKLAPGAFVIVDDYGAVQACRQAVDDYRARHGITAEITSIDWTGAWWRAEA